MTGVLVAQAIKSAGLGLKHNGIENSFHEARLLLSQITGWRVEKILANPQLIIPTDQYEVFEDYVLRRLKGEPVSKIIGLRGFWKDEFYITKDTLDPRPDTETLIEAVLFSHSDKDQPLTIVDLGTGSGCILMSLLREFPQSSGVGVEKSPEALLVAEKNRRKLELENQVTLIQGDWLNGIKDRSVDLIVSNPPYIPTQDIESLEKNVTEYDPLSALDGGEDGLDCYRKIIPQAAKKLKVGGQLFLEVGVGQARSVKTLLQNEKFYGIKVYKDIQGIDRCVSGTSV